MKVPINAGIKFETSHAETFVPEFNCKKCGYRNRTWYIKSPFSKFDFAFIVLSLVIFHHPSRAEENGAVAITVDFTNEPPGHSGELIPSKEIAIRTASSWCDAAKKCSDPKLLLDNKDQTAWCGALGEGKSPPTIDLVFDKEKNISLVRLVPFHAQDAESMVSHGRLKKIALEFDHDSFVVSFPDEKPNMASSSTYVNFLRDFYRDNHPASMTIHTKKMQMKILEVYPGTVDKDVCFSSIELFHCVRQCFDMCCSDTEACSHHSSGRTGHHTCVRVH